jgi:NAD(P)-dependent dehydrogenase (short-subunit alcohol dehydrogenase family)
MQTDLSERTVLVTGGAQGIGRGIAETLLAAGAFVVIADRDAEAGRECIEQWHERDRAIFVKLDVAKENNVRAAVARAVQRFGALDGLVNNAGIAEPENAPIEKLALRDWNRMIATDLTGAFLCAKHAVPHLRRARGAIVNISSIRARQSEPDTEAYAAAKGGLDALTHALAISLGPAVRVNGIAPGWIDVSRYKKSSARKPAKLRRVDHAQHPVGRVGEPEDIAALTAFLLSPAAGFITGQTFVADGGMLRKMQYAE